MLVSVPSECAHPTSHRLNLCPHCVSLDPKDL